MERWLREQTNFTTTDCRCAHLQPSIFASWLFSAPPPNPKIFFFYSLLASYFTQINLQEFCYRLQEEHDFTSALQIFTAYLYDSHCLKPASNSPVPAANGGVGGCTHITSIPAETQAGTGPELLQSPPSSQSVGQMSYIRPWYLHRILWVAPRKSVKMHSISSEDRDIFTEATQCKSSESQDLPTTSYRIPFMKKQLLTWNNQDKGSSLI